MSKKEDLRVTKTKMNLYEALMKLMKEKTFEEIKVSDICNIALTNRSTFYDHFADKYELLDSLINDLEKDLIKKLEENNIYSNAKEYYMQMIKIFFNHISDNINVYSSFLRKNTNSIVMDMAFDTIYKDVENHIKKSDKLLTTEIPVDIITEFYVSAVVNVCLKYIKYPNRYKKEDILKYLDVLIPDKIY